MNTITIEIPKEILSGRRGGRRLVLVDPKTFEKEIRRKWQEEDAVKASKAARREWKEGKARPVSDLKELMK